MGREVLPNAMMLRTSLSAIGSIVKKTSLDCRSAGTNSGGPDRSRGGKRGAMMLGCGEMGKLSGRLACFTWLVSGLMGLAGCGHAFPVAATFRGDASANVVANATLKGAFEVKIPSAVDPGEMMATVVRPGKSPAPCARIALVDVDGLLLNQNFGSK